MTHLVYRAEGFGARLVGWHAFPHTDQILLIERCKAVHSFGMSQRLAIRFFDRRYRALGVWIELPPNRVAMCFRAFGVIEIAWCTSEKRHQAWMAFQTALDKPPIKNWRWPDFGQKRCGKSDKSSYTNRPS